MEFNLKLNEEQTQRMLFYLGNVPYKEIADIIDTIKNQTNSQLNIQNKGE